MYKTPLQELSPNKPTRSTNTEKSEPGSSSDFRDQLYTIELNTKQSRIDLEELVNRSKKNNENLNKLISSLVQSVGVSREEVEEILEQKKRDFVDQIVPIIERLERVKHEDKENEDKANRGEMKTTATVDTLEAIHKNVSETENQQEEIKALLLSIAANNKNSEKTEAHKDLNNDYKTLQSKYTDLEGKYEQLCNLYTNKYEALKSLQLQYETLIQQTQQENTPNYELIEKLQAMHEHSCSQISIPKKKRIVSTPIETNK